MFPHRYFKKYNWMSPGGKPHSQIDHIMIGKQKHSNVLDVHLFRAVDFDMTTIWWWQKLRRDWQ
jgi:hypothetical protein